MGTLWYGSPEYACTIDDRALAHLQIVIIDKLRRGEQFAFACDGSDGVASTTFWMSPFIPLRFELSNAARVEINRGWLHALDRTAATAHGLRLVAEPPVLRPGQTAEPVRELAPVGMAR